MTDYLIVKGAREHNLKNIDVKIPRDKLIVITGLSGSGKSSLAFDTIYAEGQRRYVESLSAYARQFLGQMEKPDVDYIEGLSPAISIEQKTTGKNPRSTVGTVTEIYDYLRLLFARVGTPYCYKCGKEISKQSVEQIVDTILNFPPDIRFQLLAPVVRGRKGEYKHVFEEIRSEGFIRVRIDSQIYHIDDVPALKKNKKHTIEVVVDRLKVNPKARKRLAGSLETALHLGDSVVIINIPGQDEKDMLFSESLACVHCGISYEEISPRMFSFNSPYGACPECGGLGAKMELNPELVVPDKNKTIRQGCLVPVGSQPRGTWYATQFITVAKHYGFSFDMPWQKLTPRIQKILLYGSKEKLEFQHEHGSEKYEGNFTYRSEFEGVIPNLRRRYRQTESSAIRNWIESFMSVRPCPSCKGARLRPESLSVRINGKNIDEATRLSIKEAARFFGNLELSERQRQIARQVSKEIQARLNFMVNVGLDYLTLDRMAATLSGGEAQRIRLATQIGSSLVGVLYILDEPSIGLHQRDNARLLDTLRRLRDIGNTVIVVEHDQETIQAADYVLDLGPRAGIHGGRVTAEGSPEAIKQTEESLTGQYLSGKMKIKTPLERRPTDKAHLVIIEAAQNNLRNIDVKIPIGTFTCVTGVSGSGKSTLVNEILYKKLARHFYRSRNLPGKHENIKGLEHIDKVIDIDQSPIGRTPRSNPATYTGLFTPIRETFSQLPDAKIRGYKPGRFSFNVKGGRCESCQGDGIIKIEMHFLPDVYVPCEICGSKRYNRETLEVKYKGKTISDVLNMTVEEALDFFRSLPKIRKKLSTLYNVGLGYIHLGQSSTTLSGGEAQRVKLATELSKRGTGKTVYILDEPTTGLHFDDVRLLLKVLHGLVEKGNTVIVIEHNMDVIKTADWIIDLGPEGGDQGGEIVAEGAPEIVAASEKSYTGRFLKNILINCK
ncbi:MAG: excinuclease ABC subunit A [Candidatus Cloacimonetes bacterium 4572_55]|nr:MAG: excinuclease ABC subunit A [Candidatus Cloacimonetes bacterium 4572_55]